MGIWDRGRTRVSGPGVHCRVDNSCMSGSLSFRPKRSINEDDLAQAQPAIRALVHDRLEDVWAFCEPHLSGEADRPDPRMAELALRTLRELASLYRLGQAQPLAVAESAMTPRELAMIKIREDMTALEAKRA